MLSSPAFGKHEPEVVAAEAHLFERYPADAESVPRARAAVGKFAREVGMAKNRIEGIRLAVSEAVTNVVRHAYPGERGFVAVTAGRASDELWVLVADEGAGHQSRSPNPGLGFGLGIIAHECDDLVITERAEGGTELRMSFQLGRKATPERSAVARRRQAGQAG